MTEDLKQEARAGLIQADLTRVPDYLRSFGDDVLDILADRIDGKGDSSDYRVIIEASMKVQRVRTEARFLEMGWFIADLREKGVSANAAVMDAAVRFGVQRSTAYEASKHWKITVGPVLKFLASKAAT